MHSSLLAVSATGLLYQWKWFEADAVCLNAAANPASAAATAGGGGGGGVGSGGGGVGGTTAPPAASASSSGVKLYPQESLLPRHGRIAALGEL